MTFFTVFLIFIDFKLTILAIIPSILNVHKCTFLMIFTVF